MTTPDIGSATPHRAARIRISPAASARADIGVATDVGLRHPTNQDFAAVDVDHDGCHVVLVVADGVSSTDGAEDAARTAATTACDYLTAALAQGLPVSDDAVISLFGRAVQRAHQAVLDNPGPDGTGACTLVSAICSVDRILVANVGDTRAYWFPGDGQARRLTVDDSVAQAQIDMGMSREEAEAGAGAHAITKWIGARATDLEPRVLSIRPRMPGWVMVCSDGLWNHVPNPSDLAGIMGHFAAQATTDADGHPSPDAVATALAEFANTQGGFDNVTVALWRADGVPVRPEGAPATPDEPAE